MKVMPGRSASAVWTCDARDDSDAVTADEAKRVARASMAGTEPKPLREGWKKVMPSFPCAVLTKHNLMRSGPTPQITGREKRVAIFAVRVNLHC